MSGRVAVFSDVTNVFENEKELDITTERYKGTKKITELPIKYINNFTVYDDDFKEIQHRIVPHDVTVEPTEGERVSEVEDRTNEETEG